MTFLFEGLEVYKKGMRFVEIIYSLCKRISEKEIKDQLRRAALSVPLNIAEGNGRNTLKEKIQFYKTSRGSLFECVPLLQLCKTLSFISEDCYVELYGLAEEIGKMLNGLINSLKEPARY